MHPFERLLSILEKENKSLPAIETISSSLKKPFYVLVSGILSTRTRDEVTEQVCEKLFGRIKNLEDLSKIAEEELRDLIYPVGFYKTKAKTLKKLAKVLIENYGGKIPAKMEELLKLPGVGRKVANLVLTLGFGKKGLAVDTHVHRIANRWDYVDTETPEQTEKQLKKKLPKRYWQEINNLLVVFGREICNVKPRCGICPKRVRQICPYFEKLESIAKILNKYKFEKVGKSKIPKGKGTYILKIRLRNGRKITYGRESMFFKKGFYFYVGSAFGNNVNLKYRILRHLSKEKSKHWHIDYLLDFGKIDEIFISMEKVECKVAKDLSKKLDPIPKFGSSDCSCFSHLFFLKP